MTSILGQRFPTRPSEITAEWLTAAMRSSEAISPADEITGFTSTGVGEGIGMMGDICALTLEYAAGQGPLRSVVAKFATRNPANRAVAQGFQMYEREVRFFRDLREIVGDVAPQCYFTDIDPESGDMVLLFEDLGDYRPGDQTQGCSLADAEKAIEAVAVLHAGTWGAETSGDYHLWPAVDGPVYLHGFGSGVAAGFDPAVAAFSDVVSPDIVAAADRFKAAIPDLHARMASGPQALVHGDFRLDNFMFGTAPGHRPFVMLDFQAPIVTKAVHDIAYLLTQSVAIDVRRAEERRLVHKYHQLLVDQGVEGYSAEQCWEDYRLAALHCFEFAIVVAGTLDPTNERGRGWISASLERSSQAIVDLDLLSLLP